MARMTASLADVGTTYGELCSNIAKDAAEPYRHTGGTTYMHSFDGISIHYHERNDRKYDLSVHQHGQPKLVIYDGDCIDIIKGHWMDDVDRLAQAMRTEVD